MIHPTKHTIASSILVLACALVCLSLARAQAQWKYTALGDSLATGYLATQGYVPRYQSGIQTDTGVGVALNNLGQNGWASGNLLNALRTNSIFTECGNAIRRDHLGHRSERFQERAR